jgi:hypothetical protein
MKALKKFAAKKGISFEKELEKYVESLYKKVVPLPVRQFIDDEENEKESCNDKKKGK